MVLRKKKNRQFYTSKYESQRLKKFGYTIESNIDDIFENKELISQSDNQFLRTIRDVENKNVDLEELEELYSQKDKIYKQPRSEKNIEMLSKINAKILEKMYIPAYKTVVMNNPSHYKHLFNNGFSDSDNKTYSRLSSSAGQGRQSTVVFCEDEVIKKIMPRLNNGRDLNVPISPSKFNAYFGLYGSGTKVVSTPRFCVISDYYSTSKYMANYVIETDESQDDIIQAKEVEQDFNRFDGQGIITPEQAEKWAKELELDYVPSEWCVRQSFIKGMLCVFDIMDFCKEVNGGNTLIDTIYKDSQGNYIKVDLLEMDVILTESQFKLWDSYSSLESYQENCIANKLFWGVSLYSPKQDKDILTMNYQFIQTLNLDAVSVERLSELFVDWIECVNYKDLYKTLLFLVGKDISRDTFKNFIGADFNHWVKALMLNHNLIADKYISSKIYNMIKVAIKNGCLGNILVNGNYQVLVSDPFALMQHACGLPVTGLLSSNQFYSNYWNQKGVDLVDGMRAPLTYRSEHVLMKLENNDVLQKWYKHLTSGIILNVHGHETVNFAGSDFDMDLLATTNDAELIGGVYVDELPVVYDAPKPQKIIPTAKDLFQADMFTFGSIIGSITNKGASAYALLPLIEDDEEATNITINRLKMSTKLQSAQIDKAKIGKQVKGIPQFWVKRNCKGVDSNKKDLFNKILLDRHPYFFIYLYGDTKNKYTNYVNKYDDWSWAKFNKPLKDILHNDNISHDEKTLVDSYLKYLPVIDSNSSMNLLCKHIESKSSQICKNLKSTTDEKIYEEYLIYDDVCDKDIYIQIKDEYLRYLKDFKLQSKSKDSHKINSADKCFREKLEAVTSNIYEITDCLIRILYIDYPNSNKDVLWNNFGKYICENIKQKRGNRVLFPFQDESGDILYLGRKYKLMEVDV